MGYISDFRWDHMPEGGVGGGASDAEGPSAEEVLILLEAASRLPADKLNILLDAIWAAVGH